MPYSFRHFSVRVLGCCKLFLFDIYLYVKKFLVTGIANVNRFEGFSRRV